MSYPVRDVHVNVPFGIGGDWAAGYHTGIDFDASVGTPIIATKGGRVVSAGYGGWGSAYGNQVIIRSWHKYRFIKHLYAHLSRPNVRVGDRVKVGQVIGYSGNTGRTSGPHLHYEERHWPYRYSNHHNPVLPYWDPPPPPVSLSKLKPGKKNNDVRRLKRRLNKEFPRWRALWGPRFNEKLQRRYSIYQRRLGYSGSDANGVPGRESLKKLGFRVIK